jgi:hypothetical protein
LRWQPGVGVRVGGDVFSQGVSATRFGGEGVCGRHVGYGWGGNVPGDCEKHQPANVVAGLLTFYMVTTGWLTARRGDGVTGKFDWGILVLPVALGAWLWVTGLERVFNSTPTTDGVPAFMGFFIGSVALLSAAGDVRVLVRGGVSGTKRLVRHLWRMSFGLFIASGSFFLGPANRPLRMLSSIGLGRYLSPTFFSNGLYIFLTVLPFILMIFWLVRVRFKNAFKVNTVTVAPVSAH